MPKTRLGETIDRINIRTKVDQMSVPGTISSSRYVLVLVGGILLGFLDLYFGDCDIFGRMVVCIN